MAQRGLAENAATVSVILPNYNHGHILHRAVEALLAQDCPPGEILLIDDGSTDDSLRVIDELARSAPSIRVLRNPKNLGVVATQQRALAEARGRYVYFGAADDWVMPGFFSRAVSALEATPAAGFFSGDAAVIDGADGHSLGLRPAVMPRFTAGYIDATRVQRLFATGAHQVVTNAAVFRRDAVEAAGGLDAELGSFADGYLVRKVALARGFYYAPQVASAWCIYTTGTSRRSAMNIDNALRMLETARRKLGADPAFPAWYVERFSDRWRFATSRLVVNEKTVDFDFIRAMAARSGLDRSVLNTIWSVTQGGAGRTAVLAWLWLRLRPYRLRDLLATMIYRKMFLRQPEAKSP
jgi:glycosyltransferase involved in cell wall biosynthesis